MTKLVDQTEIERAALLREAAHTRNAELLGKICDNDWDVGSATGAASIRRPLEAALARGKITPAQYYAGLDYRRHWQFAGLDAGGISSIDYDRVSGRDVSGFSGMCQTENQVHHRQRIRRANEALGFLKRRIIEAIVIFDVRLEDVGYAMGLKDRKMGVPIAVAGLKHCLDTLMRHWATRG